MSSRHQNFEVDVCLRPDGTIDITHDPDKSHKLSIEPYFRFLSEHPKSCLWIDVKNLSEENIRSFRNSLEKFSNDYGVDIKKLIIESPRADLLRNFTDAGFYTSCYVTAANPSELTSQQCDSVISVYGEVARSGDVRAISFPDEWYAEFREQYRDTDIDFLTWKHHTRQYGFWFNPFSRRMLDDERLHVILIRDKGKYHR